MQEPIFTYNEEEKLSKVIITTAYPEKDCEFKVPQIVLSDCSFSLDTTTLCDNYAGDIIDIGIEKLKSRLGELVIATNEESMYNEEEFESYVLYEFKNEKPYNITRIDDHTWVLSGEKLENLLKKTRFNSDEALLKFARKLKNMGVDDELKTMGAKSGDTVRILDVEFEFSEKLDY